MRGILRRFRVPWEDVDAVKVGENMLQETKMAGSTAKTRQDRPIVLTTMTWPSTGK